METNPYTNDEFAKASEYLRLAISLLSKHDIPPSPLHYRLGYDVVAGKNEALKTAFDKLPTPQEGLLVDHLWDLYRQFFVRDDDGLQNVREELQRIVVNLQQDFQRSGQDLSKYAITLGRFANILEKPTPPEKMSTEVRKVITETCSMEQSQHLMELQMSSIMSEMASLRRELEQVKEESLTDALTNIPNRKAFDTALENTVHAARKQETPFCILLIDIDYFKQFNDTYGHLIGDKVLRFVAATLKQCIKGKDMVARFGGEEFAVILQGTLLGGAETVAEQIRKEVSAGDLTDKGKKHNNNYGKISVSIGVTNFRMSDLPNDIVSRADSALYLAKERGRNRVEKMI